MHSRVLRGTAPLFLVFLAAPALAQTQTDLAVLREEIAALKAQQAEVEELQHRTAAQLADLEARLAAALPSNSPVARPSPSPAAQPASAPADADPTFEVQGDIRLRYQGDYSDEDGEARNSGQVRARLGAVYHVNPRVSLGTRLVTGDPDDPNSTDVQLSEWDDDWAFELDLAYARVNFGALDVYGGKFPQLFARTDLVWDGDVNPQGLGLAYHRKLPGGVALRANGVFFVIDEQAVGPESTMAGVQLGYDVARGDWNFESSLGYYDYDLGSTAGADSGDLRANLLAPDGSYLSDFRLLDVIGGIGWRGGNERWPVHLTADYVRNLGAAVDEDSGLGIDLGIGRAKAAGDWRFTYGYSRAGVDAVLGAFSHDNLAIATNYVLHTLTVDYTPLPRTTFTGILYHYRPLEAAFAGANGPSDWLDRLRVSFQVAF